MPANPVHPLTSNLREYILSKVGSGIPGPAGPAGPQGIQGIQGIQGPIGPAGINARRLSTNPDANHIAFWKLNEVASPFVDSSLGGSPNLTLMAGSQGSPEPNYYMPWGDKSVRGRGKANEDFGRLATPGGTGPTPDFPFTIEAWCIPRGGGWYLPIFNRTGLDAGLNSVRIISFFFDLDAVSATLRLKGGIRTASATYTELTENSYGLTLQAPFQPCHVGMTYDGANIKIWHNGEQTGQLALIGSVYYGPGSAVWDLWNIMGDGPLATGNNFSGIMWDVGISNIARPLSYWQDVYATGKGWI